MLPLHPSVYQSYLAIYAIPVFLIITWLLGRKRKRIRGDVRFSLGTILGLFFAPFTYWYQEQSKRS